MSKPSRDEVFEVLGEPLAIVYVREEKTPSEHGRFTSWLINPVGIHNGTNLYTEAQALALAAAMYAAGEESAKSEGWRQCAIGQHTSQFCGQLEAEKAKAYAAGAEDGWAACESCHGISLPYEPEYTQGTGLVTTQKGGEA